MATAAAAGGADELFADSTIQFLYADKIKEADNRDVHIGDKVLALFVFVVQMGLYIYLMQDAIANIKSDSVSVDITHGQCTDKEFDTLTCDAGSETAMPVIAGMGTLICFIMSDFAGSLRAILQGPCSAKFAGILMLFKNVLAVLCGGFLARLGSISSGADALLGCVGVVFIHDMDEKTRMVYQYAPKFTHFLGLAVVLLILVVVTVVVVNSMASQS